MFVSTDLKKNSLMTWCYIISEKMEIFIKLNTPHCLSIYVLGISIQFLKLFILIISILIDHRTLLPSL